MKANELRIGNFVLQDDELIAGIVSNTLHKFEIGQIVLKPIPLTEEWLLKFGFENIDKGDNDYITYSDSNHNYYLQIDVRRKDGKYTILDNTNYELISFSMVDIVYVHQLQNLYFALTGEELTIKQFTVYDSKTKK